MVLIDTLILNKLKPQSFISFKVLRGLQSTYSIINCFCSKLSLDFLSPPLFFGKTIPVFKYFLQIFAIVE